MLNQSATLQLLAAPPLPTTTTTKKMQLEVEHYFCFCSSTSWCSHVDVLAKDKNKKKWEIQAAALFFPYSLCVCMQAAMREHALVSLQSEVFWWERFCLPFGTLFQQSEAVIGPRADEYSRR